MLITGHYRPCSQPRKHAYLQWGIHAGSHSSCMLYSRNLRRWCRKHWRCLALIRLPTNVSKNLINHLWGRLGWYFLILHLFIFPFLTLSYYFLSRWSSHRPIIGWARCLSSSSRGRTPATSTTASCHCSSSSYSLSGWLRRLLSCRCWCWRGCCSSSNHLRNRVRMWDTNLYHLDTNWIQVIAWNKERMEFS